MVSSSRLTLKSHSYSFSTDVSLSIMKNQASQTPEGWLSDPVTLESEFSPKKVIHNDWWARPQKLYPKVNDYWLYWLAAKLYGRPSQSAWLLGTVILFLHGGLPHGPPRPLTVHLPRLPPQLGWSPLRFMSAMARPLRKVAYLMAWATEHGLYDSKMVHRPQVALEWH